jgi:hypothetical protein
VVGCFFEAIRCTPAGFKKAVWRFHDIALLNRRISDYGSIYSHNLSAGV